MGGGCRDCFFFFELCDFCDWQPRFEIMWASVQITYLMENMHRWRFERGEILSCVQHFVKIKPSIREPKVSYLVSLENGILVPTSQNFKKLDQLSSSTLRPRCSPSDCRLSCLVTNFYLLTFLLRTLHAVLFSFTVWWHNCCCRWEGTKEKSQDMPHWPFC